MAGVAGNQAWFALAKQSSGRGTPATAAVDTLAFSGGTASPNREVDQLSETDASRQEGSSYVRTTGSAGSPECYVRDANIHHILELALGTLASSGTTNYTHTITPAASLPYATFWRKQGSILWEQFDDCKVSELTISADAGSPLTAAISFVGRAATRLTADPISGWSAPADAIATGSVYNYNEAEVTLAGSATSLVSSFELTITNNVSPQQTDDAVPYDVVEGLFGVSLGFDVIFDSIAEYARFHTGSTSGTAQSSSLATTSANFIFSKGANNSIAFDFPLIAYEEFPVDPDPGGAPVVASVRARSQRGGSPFVTATVKNQRAT